MVKADERDLSVVRFFAPYCHQNNNFTVFIVFSVKSLALARVAILKCTREIDPLGPRATGGLRGEYKSILSAQRRLPPARLPGPYRPSYLLTSHTPPFATILTLFHSHRPPCTMRILGRLLLILFSSLALALNAVLIGLGWMRVLFYTDWVTPNAAYPIVILLLMLVFGFLLSKTGSTAKAGASVILSTLLALVLLVVLTMLDGAFGRPLSTPLLDLVGMNSIIVEEESLNFTALSGAFLYPILWILTLLPSCALLRRFGR